MGILRRRAPKLEAAQRPPDAVGLVYERIEVTVEREWVATVVRGRPEAAGDGTGNHEDGPEKAVLEGNRLGDTTPQINRPAQPGEDNKTVAGRRSRKGPAHKGRVEPQRE